MTTNRQAYCHLRGHAWMPWGLWRVVMPDLESRFSIAAGNKPVEAMVTKHRNRQCERCGALQAQDGTGQINDEPAVLKSRAGQEEGRDAAV